MCSLCRSQYPLALALAAGLAGLDTSTLPEATREVDAQAAALVGRMLTILSTDPDGQTRTGTLDDAALVATTRRVEAALTATEPSAVIRTAQLAQRLRGGLGAIERAATLAIQYGLAQDPERWIAAITAAPDVLRDEATLEALIVNGARPAGQTPPADVLS